MIHDIKYQLRRGTASCRLNHLGQFGTIRAKQPFVNELFVSN